MTEPNKRDELIKEMSDPNKFKTREDFLDWMLSREQRLLDEIEKPLIQSLNYAQHECSGRRAFVRKITDEALSIIQRHREGV